MNERLLRKIKNLESIERFPADELFSYLPIKESAQVLDLGAGTGYISLPIANLVKGVTAFDFDKDILTYLEAKAKEKEIENIKTVQGDFKEMPLKSEQFDVAIASISLHEVQPLEKALEEVYRVLHDDGIFLCVELEKVAFIQAPRVTSDEMVEVMKRVGFTITEKQFPTTQVANQPVYVIAAKKLAKK